MPVLPERRPPATATPAAHDLPTGAVKDEEQTVEVDTELFRAKFSNRGAVPKILGTEAIHDRD